MTPLEHVAGQVDISPYLTEFRITEDNLCEWLNSGLVEEFNGNHGSGGIWASLPVIWSPRSDGRGGKPIGPALTVYVTIPVARSDEGVIYKFDFVQAVKEAFDMDRHDVILEAGEVDRARRVVDALRELADKVEAHATSRGTA